MNNYVIKVNKYENIRIGCKMDDNNCEHEFKPTLAKSGMYIILLCHKCMTSKPYIPNSWCDRNYLIDKIGDK